MDSKVPNNHVWRGFLLILGTFALGCLWPERWWGTNWLRFLSPIEVITVSAVAIGSLFISPYLFSRIASFKTNHWGFHLVVSGVLGLIALTLPIALDRYGDAIYIRQAVDISISKWDPRLLTELLEPDFLNSKAGLRTFYQINNFFTWAFGVNGTQITPIIQAAFLVATSFVWLRFTKLQVLNSMMRVTLNAAFFTAPFIAAYLGHYETYFLSYTSIIVWFALIGICLKTISLKWHIALILFFPITLQCHVTNWLLLPSLVMTLFRLYPNSFVFQLKNGVDKILSNKFPWYSKGLSWSSISITVILPFLLVLGYAYFIVWGNHDGPRKFGKEEFESALFLPIYTDEPAPYDRYSLFSLSHITDYLNLMLMWSPALLLLAGLAATSFRKLINWNSPQVVISGSTFLMFFALYFLLNPLLAASIDWDLFIAPGIILLPVGVFLFSDIKDDVFPSTLLGPVMALSFLTASFHLTNANANNVSDRIETLGKWNFKTYWIGSSTHILTKTQTLVKSTEKIEIIQNLIKELEPYSVSGNDKEFANLYLELGLIHRKETKNLQVALEHFNEAAIYSRRFGRNLYYKCITEFELGKTQLAHNSCKGLVEMRYPPYDRTLRIGIHISLAAEEYQAAANYSVIYLNLWPDDPGILEIESRLRTGDRIEALLELFENK